MSINMPLSKQKKRQNQQINTHTSEKRSYNPLSEETGHSLWSQTEIDIGGVRKAARHPIRSAIVQNSLEKVMDMKKDIIQCIGDKKNEFLKKKS